MRILGIDPGYATTGFGILEAGRGSVQLLNYGTITTPTTLTFPERLVVLYDDMVQLIETVKPDAVAVEELFWGHNVTTGIGVSHGRGVILLAICKSGRNLIYRYYEHTYSPYGRFGTRRLLWCTKFVNSCDSISAVKTPFVQNLQGSTDSPEFCRGRCLHRPAGQPRIRRRFP